MDKRQTKLRRAVKSRAKIKQLRKIRLCVHRTPQHIYAQLIDVNGKVLGVASTVNKEIKSKVEYGGNIKAATQVGKSIAEIATKLGITEVAFDRSGYKFHGRVKALAEAAREGGLIF
ncbi:MAG: 50S ribosomal protein L18 [Coxiella sp. DG_40]|nr:MAG: 50S ribosomal protein L18 [Coxiella sp. DG_40]